MNIKRIKAFYKKYPCFSSGLTFVLLGVIFHNKSMFDFAMGLFIGATLYESKNKEK